MTLPMPMTMTPPQKLQLKIFLAPDAAGAAAGPGEDAFIAVFHRWIKERRLPELLIDVANYGHVPEGPGVVVIGHGSDYSFDQGGGRPGLQHNRKRAGLPPGERLTDLARRTLYAADLLEREPALSGKVRFATGELLFRVNDRLAAPNTEQTFAQLEPQLRPFAEKLFGGAVTLTRTGAAKDLFAVRIESPSCPALATLLERAGGPPVADASLVK